MKKGLSSPLIHFKAEYLGLRHLCLESMSGRSYADASLVVVRTTVPRLLVSN